jgi:hypothetical protein
VAFGIFGKAASSDEAFWTWFVSNEQRLFDFEADQEQIFHELSGKMKKVNPDLTFEFGPIQDGKREFVMSAGGIRTAFPAVEALYEKAPALPRWVWVKFRPRRLPLNDLTYEGKETKADEVNYLLAEDGDKVGVVLFFEGYNDEEERRRSPRSATCSWMRRLGSTRWRLTSGSLSFTAAIRNISRNRAP